MSLLDSLRYRLRALLDPRGHDHDLDEEIEFHLGLESMQQAHRAADDRTPADARYAARRRFGNVTYYREESRRLAGRAALDTIAQDVRFALRTFRRAPTFTLVVIATLAIGIGANTAIFSVFDALLLRPLPYRDPSQLVHISLVAPPRGAAPGPDGVSWSVPKFAVFRAAQTVFQDLTLIFASQFTVGLRNQAIRDAGEVVDSHYLALLGIKPELGRGLLPSDDRVGAPRAVLIGDRFWRDNFDADPSVLGKTMDVDGSTYTVVGVLPPTFLGVLGRASFWIPLNAMPAVWDDYTRDPYNHSFVAVGRLARDVSFERAVAITHELGARVDRAYPDRRSSAEHWSATARPLDRIRIDTSVRRGVFILFGAVGFVLLVACANVANLFLVRASGRRREIAVRLAIGASRMRLMRQLVVESLVLSMLGAAAALGVAWIGTHLLASSDLFRLQDLDTIGGVGLQGVRLDRSALAFTTAVALVTGVAFGLVPAIQSTNPILTSALKEEGGIVRRRLRGMTTRHVLTVVELTLAVVLLAGSGLMIRSLHRLTDVEPGFDPRGMLTLRVNRAPNWARDSIDHFFDVALDRLATLPGVREIAMSDCPPINPGCGTQREAVLATHTPGSEGGPVVGVHWITPAWPTVMRMPLLRGRLFDRNDDQQSRKVVLVSETTARRFWPDQDPVGQFIANVGTNPHDTLWVVGVVGDVRYGSLDRPPGPDVYISYFQFPMSYRMMFFIRTNGEPTRITNAIRAALREVAPGFPMYETATMEWRIGDSLSYARAATTLLALFASVALILATIGTYGVISFAVAQRKREMGVRLALGATSRDLIRLVVGQGLALGAVGLVCGIAVALVVTRVLRSMLYDVAPTDPATYAGIVGVLAVAIILASLIPARRAAGVPAMTVLRSD
jgi:putative ABC transport system permease protein